MDFSLGLLTTPSKPNLKLNSQAVFPSWLLSICSHYAVPPGPGFELWVVSDGPPPTCCFSSPKSVASPFSLNPAFPRHCHCPVLKPLLPHEICPHPLWRNYILCQMTKIIQLGNQSDIVYARGNNHVLWETEPPKQWSTVPEGPGARASLTERKRQVRNRVGLARSLEISL